MEAKLLAEFDTLVARVEALPAKHQHILQADLHQLVERMLSLRMELPEGLHQLDDRLTDAAIEAQFDNLPI
ncbi:hypothetical protein U5922_007010 [Aquicoccus sp. G2-2]|jgi:hypothetical protein|uniref:hypothetical protein n=1 Tax=Aquicoccus sp. G2-2 TaxID=3092120 RepID=UPI002AE06629|nr:hypothetical protein [Aquicoccus sp. G2-2]MEA1113237.1 hypothetical protein [Aquicoccus sp. G2-2]